jgi:aspartyl-tRNA(Asn)/glutamyl-tRNA(Gln) amidotransferase subunit B
LALFVVFQAYLEEMYNSLPELPDTVRRRLPEQYGISLADTEVLLSMDDTKGSGVTFFEEVVQGASEDRQTNAGKQAVNWIVNELLGRLARKEQVWTAERVPARVLSDLLRMVENEELTGKSIV